MDDRARPSSLLCQTMPAQGSPRIGSLVRFASWEAGIAVATLVLATAVVLAHLVLIRGGTWGSDEFFNLAEYQRFGLGWFIVRLTQWSPRPASEGALYLYSLAVAHWRMPLIAPCLAILWAILIVSTLAAAWQRGSPGILPRLTIAASILAMYLLGHRVAFIFYSPAYAAPYLLDLTGITVVTIQVIAGGTSRLPGRIACGLGLALAATSSETGLYFVIAFTVAMLLLLPPSIPWRRQSDSRPGGWYLYPLAIALVIGASLVYIVATNPMRGMNQQGVFFHHAGSSLTATLWDVAPDLVGSDRTAGGLGTPAWLLMAGLLFLGFIWACRRGFRLPASGRQLAALSLGLAGCFALTIVTSLYEYGTQTHEPQPEFRKCLTVLGLLVAARLVTQHWTLRQWPSRIAGPAVLFAAVCFGAVMRVPALIADYRLIPEIREARAATWHNGTDPTTNILHFVLPPPGRVLLPLIPLLPGHFVLGAPGIIFWQKAVMTFFNKHELELLPQVEDRIPGELHD